MDITLAAPSHNLSGAGKRDYQTFPFGLGKKVHVAGVTYTMGRDATWQPGRHADVGPHLRLVGRRRRHLPPEPQVRLWCGDGSPRADHTPAG